MAMTLKKAQRKRAKLKIGMAAPSGGGKTASALILAYGIVKGEYKNLTDEECWSKIAIVDSENGSGELYVGSDIDGTHIGQYNSITLEPPYTPKNYIEAIKTCKEAGMEVCILDSTSHLWKETLEKQGNIASRTGNSFTAWREPSKEHSDFVDCMLQTDIHIIATMRSKTEYVTEKDSSGRTSVRKVGLAPVQKDGMIYEFTLFFDISEDHTANATKDRTNCFDGKYFKITPDTGVVLSNWLDGGLAEDTKDVVVMKRANPESPVEDMLPDIVKEITNTFKSKMEAGISKDDMYSAISNVNGGQKTWLNVKTLEKAKEILAVVEDFE